MKSIQNQKFANTLKQNILFNLEMMTISVRGLKRIMEFLNDNKDYSSASGYGYTVGFNIKKIFMVCLFIIL